MTNHNFNREAAIVAAVKNVADFANTLPLVIIIHELPELRLRFLAPLGLRLLGKTWEDVEKMPYEEFMQRYFNPDHFQEATEKIVAMLSSGKADEFASYFQQVRTSPTQDYEWYLNTCKVLLRDPENAPILLVTTAMRVDPEDSFVARAPRLLEEIEFMKANYERFARLGRREKDVLKLMASGRSSVEIGEQLFISPATVETHRRNIRRKLEVANNYDVNRYAQAFNLI